MDAAVDPSPTYEPPEPVAAPLAVVSEPQPLAIPTRTLPLLAVLLAAGTFVLLAAYYTVHQRTAEEIETNSLMSRARFSITYWMENGFFRSAGLAARQSAGVPVYFHRSSAGGHLLTSYALEKLFHGMTGRYSWRLLTLHNQLFSLITSALVALLAFRLAMRFGASPLHALLLAIAVEAVHFTFPDNLMLYWETSRRECFLFFAVIFLLIEDRCAERRTPLLTAAQGVAAFCLTYMENRGGFAFLLTYGLTTVVVGRADRATLKRVGAMALLPAIIAVGVFIAQKNWMRWLNPSIPMKGSTALFRTGLDGSALYYGDHRDIASRRDIAAGNFAPKAPENRPYLFRWKWTFLAGVAAFLAFLAAAMRGRAPKVAVIALYALLGTYVIDAAVFSQSAVIHPYLYDLQLYTPLMLALFVVVPTLLETTTGARGVVVVAAMLLAIWVSFVQMRHYALRYPLSPEVLNRDKSNEATLRVASGSRFV